MLQRDIIDTAPAPVVPDVPIGLPDPLVAQIRRWRVILANAYETRGTRRDLFGHNMLADPAWDMLLALALAACDRREMTVGELCASGRTSMTTALRVIDYLSDRKLVSRRPNPFDRRSILLAISETGLTRMTALIERSAARLSSANQPQEYSTCLI
ncbi:MarR family winged helix-turn-helix transcriptional regulator [Sphingomonas sp. Leaf33]|uniref:MarR family winged helix-turn-helix transcriptional regulator n=1 Tax=Sphingomonas sp. Leaf33 TaxID=1736215 RepID=UPI00138F1D60|nr:MarR family winged helix-turn-helix transcriptional regulator [Sphingomonas sp. Leaf33]